MIRTAALVATLACLTGCAIDLAQEGPPQRRYWLSPPALEPIGGEPARRSLHIAVQPVPGLDTERLLVLRPDRQLQPIAGAFWVAPVPRMLESVLSQSLESLDSHAPVVAGSTNRSSAARLVLELQRFFGVGGGDGAAPAQVVLETAATFAEGERRMRCRQRFTADVAGDSLAAVVTAHQDTVDALARWLADVIRSEGRPAGCRTMETDE